MSKIQSIKTGCENVIQATLGPTYSRLDNIIKIDKNKFASEPLRWGLRHDTADEVSGNTKANTIAYGFVLTLTDSYVTEEFGDSEIIDKQTQMIGLFEEINRQLILQYAGCPGIAHHVGTFAILASFALHEDKIVVVEGSFKVRTQIDL